MMKFGRELIRNLAETTNVVNTLNGGMINPVVKLKKLNKGQELNIRIPSAEIEDVKVEINNNILSVVYYMNLTSDSVPFRIPNVILSRPIPYFINIPGIRATIDEKDINVYMPYNKLANGFHKEINIESDK